MRSRARIRKDNGLKLHEATRMAMGPGVLVVTNGTELFTASLSPALRVRERAKRLLAKHQVLGIFNALPGEDRRKVFFRLWEEASAAGVLLPKVPPDEWVAAVSVPRRACAPFRSTQGAGSGA